MSTAHRKGYDLEVNGAVLLRMIWPSMYRTGSIAYLKDAPDLVTADHGVVVQCKKRKQTWVGSLYRGLRKASPKAKFHLILTRDLNQPMLITLPVTEFVEIANGHR